MNNRQLQIIKNQIALYYSEYNSAVTRYRESGNYYNMIEALSVRANISGYKAGLSPFLDTAKIEELFSLYDFSLDQLITGGSNECGK